jgi:hypothetical protein
MSVSGNFTVPDNLPKLFVFHNIRKNIGGKYGAVSENFTIAQISYNHLFFCCFIQFFRFLPHKCQSFLQSTVLPKLFWKDLHSIN